MACFHRHTYKDWKCIQKRAIYDSPGCCFKRYQFTYIATCTECGKLKKKKV